MGRIPVLPMANRNETIDNMIMDSLSKKSTTLVSRPGAAIFKKRMDAYRG